MNYNASQALCFTWQLDGRYLEMDLRVSSRGKLYFLQAREMAAAKGRSRARHGPLGGQRTRHAGKRGGHRVGERVDPNLLLPAALRPHMVQLQAILQAHGLWRLPNARKQQPAPGCLTRLGDEPATLFEVLFAEIE